MERMSQPEVKVYSKENCVQCTATERKLGQLGIAYSKYMLEDEPEALEAFKADGLMQAPIVVFGEEKWAGYRPDRIKALGGVALNDKAENTIPEGASSLGEDHVR